MSDLASRLLRSLLISMIGTLAVVSAAQAHGSRNVENGWLASPEVAISSSDTVRSSLAQACVARAGTRSVVALPIPQRTPPGKLAACDEGKDDHRFGDCCYAVACHMAVADPGLVSFVSSQPTGTEPLVNPSALHGRAVAPGDRPPRSA